MTKITKEEEMELWKDLEEIGILYKEVMILPECCAYIGKDHNGNELWKGKKYTYLLIKEA